MDQNNKVERQNETKLTNKTKRDETRCVNSTQKMFEDAFLKFSQAVVS